MRAHLLAVAVLFAVPVAAAPQRAHVPPHVPRPALDVHRLLDVRFRLLHDGARRVSWRNPG